MTYSTNKFFACILISFFLLGCEGEEGPVGPEGPNGLNSLVNVNDELAGANCQNGGIKVEVGVDTNSNGQLDINEVQNTSYVCNGIDGDTSLSTVAPEPIGSNCENGGVKINTGLDINNNGTLDDSEILATAYACNGVNGDISLVNIAQEPIGENCENGGVKIESGIDENKDGILNQEEIQVTRYVCNGLDGGVDEQIILAIWSDNTSSSAGFLPDSIVGELIKFDKRNWVGTDSIIFVPKFATGSSSVTAFAELYNQTDNVAINNSIVSTNNTTISHIESNNIFSNLPDAEIDLSIRLSTENGSSQINMNGTSYLILYRNN